MTRLRNYVGTSLIVFTLATLGATAPSYGDDHPRPRTVSTSGQGLIKVPADQAEITMQVTSTQKSATAAKGEVDRRINTALASLTALGISKKDMVAATLRLAPEYEYHNNSRTFAGYNASRDLIVTLKDLDKLDKALEAATGSGIDIIQAITLTTSREEDSRGRAYEMAIADSLAKARSRPSAYGAELGAIHSICYQGSEPMIAQKAEMGMLRAADARGGQYLHDDISFRDQVQVVFELMVPR